MALVSPGLELSVTDESQYVPGAVGTVPLIIMATAQDKTSHPIYSQPASDNAHQQSDNDYHAQHYPASPAQNTQSDYPKTCNRNRDQPTYSA